MFKFRSYPIYVVYSRNKQAAANDMGYWYYVRQDQEMYHWSKLTLKEIVAIEEDSEPKYRQQVTTFNSVIRTALDIIFNTKVGRTLLNLLNPNEKIWIIPDPDLNNNAMTGPATVKGRGGIRLRINPEQWIGTLDDTLVHELVHALRFSNHRFNRIYMTDESFPDSEEFIATQVASIFRSERGKKQIYGSYYYMEGQWALKGSVYQKFVETPELIMALKHFLDYEELAKKIAFLKGIDFNPFKDYPVLSRVAQSKLGGGEFMPL